MIIIKILQKIKDFFTFNCCFSYVCKHYLSVDEKLDYLMEHGKIVYTSNNDGYRIIIELDNDEVYSIWNSNYPYAWLCVLTKLNDRKSNEVKEEIIYKYRLPTVKKMKEFKNWVISKYPYWEPHKDDKVRDELLYEDND